MWLLLSCLAAEGSGYFWCISCPKIILRIPRFELHFPPPTDEPLNQALSGIWLLWSPSNSVWQKHAFPTNEDTDLWTRRMDLSRWNTVSLRISVLEYLTSSAVFLPLNHDFFFFLLDTYSPSWSGSFIHFQLPNKLKMNSLSRLLYFFSSELFCGFPPASMQTAPSCSSSSRSSSSFSTLTQENQDFSCKVSILCQATLGESGLWTQC